MRLNSQEYSDTCWEKVHEYVIGVESGEIIVGKYIKKIVSKYSKLLTQKDKYVYKVAKVDKVFKFFSLLNIEHKNSYVQFNLMPWQCFVLAYAFGFYYENDPEKRLVREVLLFMARKNGKTAFAAALQMYGMLADGVENPQSLLLANTAGQASISLNFAKNMVNHTPELYSRLIGQRSRIIFRDNEKQGFSQIFSTVEPSRLEGHSPSMAILDECHAYNDNAIYAAIKTGVGARINPMVFLVSTAGSKNNGFLNDYLKQQKNILDDNIENDSILSMIYQPDEEDDLSEPLCWCKANPSLSVINTLDDLLIAYKSAKHSTSDKYFFITKHLNIFYDTPETWIPEDYLLPVFDNDFDEEILYGKDIHIGMDLSKNTDLSSIVAYVSVEDDENFTSKGIKGFAIPYFWMAELANNRVRKNGKDLSNWIYDKFITKCESKTIDLDLIYDKIIELSEKFNIVSIQYDPYNAIVLNARLKEYFGEDVVVRFSQNASKFNAPLKHIEDMIYNTSIRMKNPCLLWNFSNVVLYIDGNQNIKISKNKQNDSVDGCVALAMALGGYLITKYGDEITNIQSFKNNM